MNEEDWNKNIRIMEEVIVRNILDNKIAAMITTLVSLGDTMKSSRDYIWIAMRELACGNLDELGEEE